jgi:hypothetical protein
MSAITVPRIINRRNKDKRPKKRRLAEGRRPPGAEFFSNLPRIFSRFSFSRFSFSPRQFRPCDNHHRTGTARRLKIEARELKIFSDETFR